MRIGLFKSVLRDCLNTTELKVKENTLEVTSTIFHLGPTACESLVN